jgi:hypothetical protein
MPASGSSLIVSANFDPPEKRKGAEAPSDTQAQTGKRWRQLVRFGPINRSVPMETSEISLHQVKVYEFALSSRGWVTAKEIAAGAGVAQRTARAHALKFVQLGVFDQAELFPAHRYQLSSLAAKRNKTFIQRLEAAREMFGLPA